jgi:pyruvate/2-oxoglutarate dehydrogenase complex dihydrolipoamide acyltransferase (E2) component
LQIGKCKLQIEQLCMYMSMPRHELTLPDLGIEDQPITVSSWLVKRGTRVTENEPVLEVLCGGITVDLPAAIDGFLVEKLVSDDELLKVGQGLAIIDTSHELNV